MYRVVLTSQAEKDREFLKQAKLLSKTKSLLDILEGNPFQTPPKYEKLLGFKNQYSRRINGQHRLWYSIDKDTKIVRILRMWTHYELNYSINGKSETKSNQNTKKTQKKMPYIKVQH